MNCCSICDKVVNHPCETFCEAVECDTARGSLATLEDMMKKNAAQRLVTPPVLYAPNPVKQDVIVHPNHYSRWKMEPIEFIMINDLPGWLANVIKYTMRFDAKDGLIDLYKGRSYLDMKIRQLEGHPRYWEKSVAEERRLNVG